MIIEFEHDGETVRADVALHGHDDRDPRSASSDFRYEVRWLDDGGVSDLRELDGLAIDEFRAVAP